MATLPGSPPPLKAPVETGGGLPGHGNTQGRPMLRRPLHWRGRRFFKPARIGAQNFYGR